MARRSRDFWKHLLTMGKGSFATAFMIMLALLLAGCSHSSRLPTSGSTHVNLSPAPTVTREETIRIAEAYRTHRWRPTAANSFSGEDTSGIHVQTPDVSYQPTAPDSRPGWWKPAQTNVGIPYQWGGFDTPQDFDRKIADGRYAGDLYTLEKRRNLEDSVSRYACVIDCSGLSHAAVDSIAPIPHASSHPFAQISPASTISDRATSSTKPTSTHFFSSDLSTRPGLTSSPMRQDLLRPGKSSLTLFLSPTSRAWDTVPIATGIS